MSLTWSALLIGPTRRLLGDVTTHVLAESGGAVLASTPIGGGLRRLNVVQPGRLFPPADERGSNTLKFFKE